MKKNDFSSADSVPVACAAGRMQRKAAAGDEQAGTRSTLQSGRGRRRLNLPQRKPWSSATPRSIRKTGKKPLTPTAPTTAGPASATASGKRWCITPTAMELEPWLATVTGQMTAVCTWTITLRDGVTFSSGRDMDGEAVKQCLESPAGKPRPRPRRHEDRGRGRPTVRYLTVTTSEPNPALMNYLGDPYGCIIDVDAS